MAENCRRKYTACIRILVVVTFFFTTTLSLAGTSFRPIKSHNILTLTPDLMFDPTQDEAILEKDLIEAIVTYINVKMPDFLGLEYDLRSSVYHKNVYVKIPDASKLENNLSDNDPAVMILPCKVGNT